MGEENRREKLSGRLNENLYVIKKEEKKTAPKFIFRQLLRIKPYSKNTFVGHCTFIATVPIPELFECAVCMLCVCVCISRERGHRSGTMTDRDGRRREKG